METAVTVQSITGVKMEELLVTPDLARRWLEENRYPEQRPLSPRRVEEFQTYLRLNEWGLDVIRFHHVESTGKTWLTDGQHRLTAIANEEKAARCLVHTYHVATVSECRADYGRFDTPKIRTFRDVLPATDLRETTALSANALAKGLAAVRIIQSDFRSANSGAMNFRDNTHRVKQLIEWIGPLEAYWAAIDGRQAGLALLSSRAVMAVGLVTCRDQAERASAFWSRVAANDGLQRGDPEWVLVDLVTGQNRRSGPMLLTRLVASCWNADFQQKSIYRASGKADVPILIEGTHWGKSADA